MACIFQLILCLQHLSHLYMTTGKTIALTLQTFAGKVMSLFFKMLSNFVKAFLQGESVFYFHRNSCENWTIETALHWRSDAFRLWGWRRLLRVLWTAKRSSQSILKEIISEYSLEGLLLKLKLQHFGHLIWRVESLEKTLMLGTIEGRRRGGQDELVD